jgi:hypothetical protein
VAAAAETSSCEEAEAALQPVKKRERERARNVELKKKTTKFLHLFCMTIALRRSFSELDLPIGNFQASGQSVNFISPVTFLSSYVREANR